LSDIHNQRKNKVSDGDEKYLPDPFRNSIGYNAVTVRKALECFEANRCLHRLNLEVLECNLYRKKVTLYLDLFDE